MLIVSFGTLEDFEPIVGSLLPDYRLIVMDARGLGKSTLEHQPLTYRLIQEYVEQLLDHFYIGKIILMGFGDGGMIVHRMAIFHPKKG